MRIFGMTANKTGEDLWKRAEELYNSSNTQEIHLASARYALAKMFQPRAHFNVCVIDHLSDSLGVVISSTHRQIYRNMHCVDWSEMDPVFRDQLVAMILSDFSVLKP